MDLTQIIAEFAKNDIIIDEKKANQFYIYKNILQKYNKVMDLTNVDDDLGIINRHFIDSLMILNYQNFKNNDKVIDVGTGAGFPSVPLAIMLDDVNFVAIDSLNKRVNFLNEIKNQLQLQNIEFFHTRAEDFANKKEYREMFDFAVSRAVAPLSILCEYSLPFLKNNAFMIALKSKNIDEEINLSKKALNILKSNIDKIVDYKDPRGILRKIVFIKKNEFISKKYPRKSGIAKKIPL